jgi:hypothetical protein
MAPVPELAAKKAKREEAWAVERAAQKAADATKAKETRRVIFKKAAQYVNEYRQQVRRAGVCSSRCFHCERRGHSTGRQRASSFWQPIATH